MKFGEMRFIHVLTDEGEHFYAWFHAGKPGEPDIARRASKRWELNNVLTFSVNSNNRTTVGSVNNSGPTLRILLNNKAVCGLRRPPK